MDDHSTGRGVYVVRRLLAVLVILLLLALLVSQAYQTLLAPRDGTGSGVQDTAEVAGSGEGANYVESAPNGETAVVADNIIERQKDPTHNQTTSGETGASDGVQSTGGGVEIKQDEYSGVQNMELDAGLAAAGGILEELVLGDVNQMAPILAFYDDGQQTINPTVPVEPIELVTPPLLPEPITFETSLVPENLGYYDEYPAYYEPLGYYDEYSAYYDEYPAYYEYLGYYDEYLSYYDAYSAYYGYLAYYEDPVSYEEQIFDDPDPLNAYGSAASETTSDEESGGYGAYAAINAD
jgi:hypothetical protein